MCYTVNPENGGTSPILHGGREMTLLKRFIVLLWLAASSAQLGCIWLMFGGGAPPKRSTAQPS